MKLKLIMVFSLPEKTKFARSLEKFEKEHIELREYYRSFNLDLEEKILEVLRKEPSIGEGRAAKVFELIMERSHIPVCIKIWRQEVLKQAQTAPIEYKKVQYLSPEEEFDLQDSLYLDGFEYVPQPLAFGQTSGLAAMIMERIRGYSLAEIDKQKAKIANPSYSDLKQMVFKLNIEHRVVHRDLHSGNVMLETDQTLVPDGQLSGRLFLIDFGLSKRIYSRPTEEDFQLTISHSDVIRYRHDERTIKNLQPSKNSPFLR